MKKHYYMVETELFINLGLEADSEEEVKEMLKRKGIGYKNIKQVK